MADYDALYPGRFLKGKTLEEPLTIRIRKVVPTELEGDDGKKATGVLEYVDRHGKTGEIVWCKTNSALTAATFGGERDYTKWAGRVLTIYNDPNVKFGREKVGGIRVYGSPELTAAINVEVKMPRKKTPDRYTLRPTGKNAAPANGNGNGKPADRGAGGSVDSTSLDDRPPPPEDEPGSLG